MIAATAYAMILRVPVAMLSGPGWLGPISILVLTRGLERPVVPRVLDQSAARLHQPVLQACQRPALDPLRQPKPPPEIAEVVGQHAQLQSHFVGPEAMTRQPGPTRGLFAFLDSLFRRAALVVEANHRATGQGHARHDESDARKQLALVMLDLGDNPSGLRPARGLDAELLGV